MNTPRERHLPFRLLVALAVAVGAGAGGCYGSMLRENARVSASRDHSCARDMVSVEEDACDGATCAFWMRVCGQRLFYVYRPTPGRAGEARFYDETAQAMLRRR